ncbi:endonuclease subunit [uncultured Caudovirales phage]|uniref:Endonuclease subunit n=1 Tax=uncultured Caudovirales phage TaxID=2100421 RepID=A0A6J5M5W8_9CAUD|nr:endonuclease subunit [uncultured Caudovirales phage]
MIHFKAVRWKNFLSTGNIFTEVLLSSKGTTLIVGENGAGKSTILDAITFSLFGKTFRNINKPQLINTITRKELVAEIEFSIQSNHYKIVRGIKPNVFEVYCNGVLLNQSAEMRDYQEVLEKSILKINYKSFCQVVILGSASFVPFMQLPAAQRRSIIEDLLDLQVFTTMNTLLKEKVQDNANLLQVNDNERKIVEAKIKMVKEHLKEIQSKNEQFVREKMQAVKDVESKIDETTTARIDLIEQATALRQGAGNIDSIKKRLDKLKDLRSQMEVKTKLLAGEVEFFSNHDNCPTCKQSISSDFSCEIVDKRNTEISEISAGLEKLVATYNDNSDKLKDLLEIESQADDLLNKASHEALKIKLLNEQLSTLLRELKEAKKTAKETSDVKVVDLENELSVLSNSYNLLQEDKQVLFAASLLLKDGGIKTRIVNQYIPVINKLINKYLSEFDLFVEFNLDEQFNEVIKSRYRDQFSYASFSEGEKQKIDLAILFTWRAVAKLRNSLSTNLLILDEVFDSSLDGQSADDLLKILQNISKDSNVFIISHRDTLHDKFENTIKFVKTKSFSRIAE